MLDTNSNNSYRLSNVSSLMLNSLNPVASINPSIINKIKKQVQLYEGATQKCILLWQNIKKNDFSGFRLSQKVIENIFEQFQDDIYNFTKITSLKEFMNIFDNDKDGFLDQDQQIKIFSYIKQRMQLAANNSLKIQSYSSFKTIMKQVRLLEANITKWQEYLRNKIHDQQLLQYRKIGQSKVDEFCLYFDKEFEILARIKQQRRENFEKQVCSENQRFEEKLNKVTEHVKIKPKRKIKELQVQQKLISLEERVQQAEDLRRELNQLEESQKQRIHKLIQQNEIQQRQNLMKKQEKGRKQLQLKLQELQFKLIIKMKKQFDILQKKNKLHQNQITRIQTLETKWAIKKGTFEPELKRIKKLQKKRNQILSEYKRVQKIVDDIKLETQPSIINSSSNNYLKLSSSKFTKNSILEATTNFQINKKIQSQLPINKTSLHSRLMATKLNKFLQQKKSIRMVSICGLYDENLDEKVAVEPVNKNIQNKENERRRNFILSKIF